MNQLKDETRRQRAAAMALGITEQPSQPPPLRVQQQQQQQQQLPNVPKRSAEANAAALRLAEKQSRALDAAQGVLIFWGGKKAMNYGMCMGPFYGAVPCRLTLAKDLLSSRPGVCCRHHGPNPRLCTRCYDVESASIDVSEAEEEEVMLDALRFYAPLNSPPFRTNVQVAWDTSRKWATESGNQTYLDRMPPRPAFGIGAEPPTPERIAALSQICQSLVAATDAARALAPQPVFPLEDDAMLAEPEEASSCIVAATPAHVAAGQPLLDAEAAALGKLAPRRLQAAVRLLPLPSTPTLRAEIDNAVLKACCAAHRDPISGAALSRLDTMVATLLPPPVRSRLVDSTQRADMIVTFATKLPVGSVLDRKLVRKLLDNTPGGRTFPPSEEAKAVLTLLAGNGDLLPA